jgi:RNA polymerase sigma factor (sigma-70 family)
MLHHSQGYLDGVAADRRAAAELERTVRAARSGDTRAWAALLERFTSRVRHVARRHRLRAEDVDDVVQTTWLRLLEHLDGVREPAALGAWLETTARRECLRTLRSGEREAPTDVELFADIAAPPMEASALEAAERREALAHAVKRLPRRQRALLRLLLDDPAPSYFEIASTLDMPIGSIGPTRARCLARLRQDLQLARVLGDEA